MNKNIVILFDLTYENFFKHANSDKLLGELENFLDKKRVPGW